MKVLMLLVLVVIVGCSNNIAPSVNHADIISPVEGSCYEKFSIVPIAVKGTNINRIEVWTSVNPIIVEISEPFALSIKTKDETGFVIYIKVIFNDNETETSRIYVTLY